MARKRVSATSSKNHRPKPSMKKKLWSKKVAKVSKHNVALKKKA